MKPPRLHPAHPDHLLECEEALEAGVAALFAAATAAGWGETVVAAAIISLADNFILGAAANAKTDSDIAAALERVRGV